MGKEEKSLTPEEKKAIFDRWKNGNESADALCEEFGLPKNTIFGWNSYVKRNGFFPGTKQKAARVRAKKSAHVSFEMMLNQPEQEKVQLILIEPGKPARILEGLWR